MNQWSTKVIRKLEILVLRQEWKSLRINNWPWITQTYHKKILKVGSAYCGQEIIKQIHLVKQILCNVWLVFIWNMPGLLHWKSKITNAFQKFTYVSGHNSNIWADQINKFFNISMKSWIYGNGIEIYSKENEGKSVIIEKVTRILKAKITSV